ncbi:hypothetical protein ACFXTI_013174 [Malus domestica]
MVFFKCFKSSTITILAKEGNSQDRGTTLKLYAPLTVSWEVVDYVQPDTKKKACTSRSLILNSSHHVRDNHLASSELLGDRIRSEVVTWSSTLSTIRGAAFVEFYWEWLEDVLSCSKDVLTNMGLHHAIYASLFSYDCHPSILRAFFEHWCSTTNTLHTAQGEMLISLRDLHNIGGLPIQGKFYNEVVPRVEDFSYCNSRGLPASCRYLFWA